MALSEPAPGMSYSDVAFYRKQWFAVICLLFFVPALILISMTGPVYAKANKKQRQQADAEVWEVNGAGRFVFILCGVVVLANGLFRAQQAGVFEAFSNDRPTASRPAEPAAEPAASADPAGPEADPPAAEAGDDVEAEAEPASETAEAADVAPATDGFPAYVAEVQAQALSWFEKNDASAVLADMGIDTGYGIPQPDGAVMTRMTAQLGSNTVSDNAQVLSVVFETEQSVDEVAAFYRDAYPAMGWPLEFEEAEDGEVDLSFGGFRLDDTRPEVDNVAAGLFLETTDEGLTRVSVIQQVFLTGEVELGGLHGAAVRFLSPPNGYAVGSVDVSVSNWGGPIFPEPSVEFTVESLATPTPDEVAELTRITEELLATGLWTIDRELDWGTYLVRADGLEGDLLTSMSVGQSSRLRATFRAE